VNLEAITEYDELEQRYQFLTTQESDLLAAKEQILKAIQEINRTTQRLFAETFEQVKANFQEMFTELFVGGKATLETSVFGENLLNAQLRVAGIAAAGRAPSAGLVHERDTARRNLVRHRRFQDALWRLFAAPRTPKRRSMPIPSRRFRRLRP